jgi:hypothetical protein
MNYEREKMSNGLTQNKDINRLLKIAGKQGWRIERNRRGGHFKCFSPDGKTIVIVACTTVSRNAVKKARANFEAGGLKI